MGQTRKEWLQTVTAQLRCRRAVPGVERELENHLSEQYNAFVAQGCAPEEAERRTVESMETRCWRRRAGPRAQAPPAWGPFLWCGAVAGGCAAAFFLERARFGTRRVPVARGRVPKPGRRLGGNCCACGGIFLYGCVPVGTLDKGALYRAGGRFGLWFSGRIYPDERAASLDCLGCILRRHSFQHDFYSHLRGRGVPGSVAAAGRGCWSAVLPLCRGSGCVSWCRIWPRRVCWGLRGLPCVWYAAQAIVGLGGKKSFAVVLGVTAGSLVVTFLLVLLLMPGLAGSLQRHLEVLLAPDANAAGAGYWMNALRRMWDGMRWLGPGDSSLPLGEKAALGTVGEFAGKAVRELRADYLLAYAGWRYGIA